MNLCGENGMRFFSAVLAFFFIFLSGTVNESLAGSGQSSFVRNDRVLTWQSANSDTLSLRKDIFFKIDSNLSSSLNFSSGAGLKDRWYDTVFNQAGVDWTVSDKLFFGVTAKEDWNRDSQSTVGKSLLTTGLEGNANYTQSEYFNLNGTVGYINDQRFENEDKGATVGGGFVLKKPAGHFKTKLSFDGATSNLKRTNDLLNVEGRVLFDNSIANIDLGLEQNSNTKGYFSEVDRSKVEERARTEKNLNLLLSRGDGRENTKIDMVMTVGERKLDDTANENKSSSKYHNNSNGSVKNFGLSLNRGLGRFVGSFDAGYLKDSNDVELLIRSRTQTDISIKSNIGLGIGEEDTLNALGGLKRTRIDTPKSVPNDRDELKFEGGLNYKHHFSNIFETALDFRVLQTHYVNIDASQSSQNKWVDTYQISPSMTWTPSRAVRITHNVGLYANVMDYDFDTDINPKSNITRRVSSETTLDANLSSRLVMTITAMFENNEFASLDTKGYKLPSEEGIRRFGDIILNYKFYDWLVISPNYSYSIRSDSNVELDKLIRREEDQTFRIICELFKNGNSTLSIDAKRIIRRTEEFPVRIRDYVNITMRYEF